jgi:flagellar basal-body rod protein FlgC
MSLFRALEVSSSGLTAHRLRKDIIAQNLANAQTTRGPGGQPYRRQQVVFASESGDPLTALRGEAPLHGVRVLAVVPDRTPFVAVYNPSHPDADANGFVLMPNVQPAIELVDMISATRAYEANAASIEAVKQMANRVLEILR